MDGTSRHLTESERIRQRTEDLISQRQADFEDQLQRNKDSLDSLDSDVSDLGGRLADINNMVRRLAALQRWGSDSSGFFWQPQGSYSRFV